MEWIFAIVCSLQPHFLHISHLEYPGLRSFACMLFSFCNGYLIPGFMLGQIQFRKHFIAGNAGVRSNDQQFQNSGVFRSWNQHPLTRFEAWDSSMDAGVTSAAQTTVDEEFTDSNMSSMNGAKPNPYIVVNLGSVSRRIPFQRLAVWTAVVITMFQLRDFVGVISPPCLRGISGIFQYFAVKF